MTKLRKENQQSAAPRLGAVLACALAGLTLLSPWALGAEQEAAAAETSAVSQVSADLESVESEGTAGADASTAVESVDDNPFARAANAPADGLSTRTGGSGALDPSLQSDPIEGPINDSIAEILGEVDPDLEQIQAQIDAGEYEIPKLWLSQKIQDIQHSSHRFDPALVRPMTMLGDIQVQEGDYVGALESFGRAVHLERVNSGLISPAQIEIVYREAEVYRALGDYKSANEREEYAYHVLQRAHEPYSEDMLPGLFHLAQWYEKTHNVFAARHLYQRAADVLTANGKGQSLQAIPAWEGLARSYRLERFPPVYMESADTSLYAGAGATQASYGPVTVNNFPAGERALQNIIQIHRANHASTPVIAQSILNLADWHLLFEKTREAYPLYEVAYQMMQGVEDFPVADFFGEPKLIHFPVPPDPSAPDDAVVEPVEGHVSIQLEISDRGSPRRLETIASEPPGLMDFRVRKSLRASRFRPAIVDGQPVQTENYVFTHTFSYYPEPALIETTEEEAQ